MKYADRRDMQRLAAEVRELAATSTTSKATLQAREAELKAAKEANKKLERTRAELWRRVERGVATYTESKEISARRAARVERTAQSKVSRLLSSLEEATKKRKLAEEKAAQAIAAAEAAAEKLRANAV